MPIDPSIPLQVKNIKLESPMNQLAMMGEAVKLGEMQRGVDTQNKLRELYSQGIDVSTPEGFKQVASLDPATALKLRADALQGQKLQGEIKKTGFELTEKGMGIMRERSKDLLQNPSNENYIAHIQEGLRDGLISPEQAKRSVQIYTAIPANERVAYITQGLAKAEKLYETKTISAAQQQADLTTRRGQDIMDARARRGQDMARIPAGFRMTPEGTLEAIPGGPTTTNLTPKEIQAREAKFPQATLAVKSFEAKTSELEKDLIALRDHPGLPSITGIAAGRAPGITKEGRAAQALYDKILARGGFKELQDMRAASPTGGALGNVSNQEGTQLRQSFAAIDRVQDAADVQKAINTAITDLQGSKGRVREAYDMTYDYKGGASATPPPPPPPPAPSAGGNTVTIPSGKVLTFPTPEAAAAYKKAANIKD
jgi:hypothetical protein